MILSYYPSKVFSFDSLIFYTLSLVRFSSDMSALMILAIAFVVLTIMGVPLFVSVGLTTALALYLIDIPYTLMAQTGYGSLTPFPLLTIPLFVLAGRLMEVGGMATRMISIATNLVGAYRGSMGLVTVFACMLFAALHENSEPPKP